MLSITRRLTSCLHSPAVHQKANDTTAAKTGRAVALSFGSTVPHHHCTSLVSDHYVTQTDSGPIHHAARVIILCNTPTQELRATHDTLPLELFVDDSNQCLRYMLTALEMQMVCLRQDLSTEPGMTTYCCDRER
jgi:hypothetical protein